MNDHTQHSEEAQDLNELEEPLRRAVKLVQAQQVPEQDQIRTLDRARARLYTAARHVCAGLRRQRHQTLTPDPEVRDLGSSASFLS